MCPHIFNKIIVALILLLVIVMELLDSILLFHHLLEPVLHLFVCFVVLSFHIVNLPLHLWQTWSEFIQLVRVKCLHGLFLGCDGVFVFRKCISNCLGNSLGIEFGFRPRRQLRFKVIDDFFVIFTLFGKFLI